MNNNATFVIVGAGLAGAKAAETLRRDGFDGRVVLIGREMLRPCERPPLSKDSLRGEDGRDGLFVHDGAFYGSERIEVRRGRAVDHVHVRSSEVVSCDDERLHDSRVLLTTGSEPRSLGVPGGGLTGASYLRNANDSDALRARFSRGAHVGVIGAGWIGDEVAASARTSGLDVTMIAPDRVPLDACLRPAMSPTRSTRSLTRGSASNTGRNALNQGPIAAESMLGRFATYERRPYFYSDQYDVGMEYTGHAPTWDRIASRGDPSTRSLVAFWLLDGRVVAGMNVNVWEAASPIERLIRSRALVDDRLADHDLPLEQWIPDAQRSDA